MAYIDPVKAAADNYKLLFEDDTHRVLEMTLAEREITSTPIRRSRPCCRPGWHW